MLPSCEKLRVIYFDSVQSPNRLIVTTIDFSSDQKWLFNIKTDVIKGKGYLQLAGRNPKKFSVARFIKKASRIVRSWMRTKQPSSELRVLVQCVVCVYIIMWFLIKCLPAVIDDPKHLWNSICFTRYLKDNLCVTNHEVIQIMNISDRRGIFCLPCYLTKAKKLVSSQYIVFEKMTWRFRELQNGCKLG